MEKKSISIDNLNEFNDLYFHFTSQDNLYDIENNGLLSKVGKNSEGLETKSRIYFSQGPEGLLQLCDIWINWLLYKKLEEVYQSQFGSSKGYNDWFIENRHNPQWIDEVINESIAFFQNQILFTVKMDESKIDYFDEIKDRNIKNNNLGILQVMYGANSDLTSNKTDKWNMNTKAGVNISSDDLKQLSTDQGNDLLSIINTIYASYEKKDTLPYLKQLMENVLNKKIEHSL